MAKTRTLTATMPDGTTEKRITARNYTHVVAVERESGWCAVSWASRLELAQKASNQWYGAKIILVNT